MYCQLSVLEDILMATDLSVTNTPPPRDHLHQIDAHGLNRERGAVEPMGQGHYSIFQSTPGTTLLQLREIPTRRRIVTEVDSSENHLQGVATPGESYYMCQCNSLLHNKLGFLRLQKPESSLQAFASGFGHVVP